MYNDYNNGQRNRRPDNNRNNRNTNKNSTEKKIFDESLKQKSVTDIAGTKYDYAEIINKIKTTTTQIRQLLSNSVVVRNKIEMALIQKKIGLNDNLTDELRGEVEYLLIKFIYQCGREERVYKFNDEFKIATMLNKINTPAEFYTYYRYLEKIVAYVKFYRNEREH